MSHLRPLALAGLVLALAPSSGAAQKELRRLSPAAMQQDLFQLTEVFEREHAGLRRYATQEQLDEAFGRALHAVERELDVLAFYRVISEVVSGVHCGHTRVQMSSADQLAVLGQKGLLPLQLHLVGERAWVRHVLADGTGIEPGSEVTAIDGIPLADIRRVALGRMSGDGFIETGRERALERSFARHFLLLADDLATYPEHYELRLNGSTEPAIVAGVTLDEFQARHVTGPERRLVELTIEERDDYAHLYVRDFGDSVSQGRLPDLLDGAFRQLREKGIGHLILDLRGNGGGRDMYGAGLVSYLSREPFGYFERIEVTPDYSGDGVRVVEQDGRRLVLSHDGLQIQQPAAHRFLGEVFFLIDGWTFSTAADVATVAHHNGLATFIGEETGGGYDGNTSGESESIVLPASGFAVSVPQWMYTTANLGHDRHGRGAPADHPVRAKIEDALAGRDVELEKAVELIRAGR